MGWMAKVAQVVAGEKPSVGGLLSRAGLVGGLGAGGAWLMSPEEERAAAPPNPELEGIRSRVSELQEKLRVLSNGTPEEKQQFLIDAGHYVKPDGKIGKDSSEKIGQFTTATIAELDKLRPRLAELETEATQQAAYEATAPGEKRELLREFGWIPATAGAIALGALTRGGAVKKAAIAAAKKAADADALLMPGVAVGKGVGNPKGLTSRAANLNEFWLRGGADDAVPFTYAPKTGWKSRPKSMEPSQLFPDENTGISKFIKPNDVKAIGSGTVETGLSGVGWAGAEAELKAAQEAVDEAPTEKNLARLERARDLVAITSGAFRMGLGFSASRGLASLAKPYQHVRPNVPGAEAERALLLDYIRGLGPG